MQSLFDIISTREFAHITLLGLLFLILFARSKQLRNSTSKLIKLILEPKTFLIFDLFALYETTILLFVTYHPLWKNAFCKDFLFWIALGGFPALMNNLRMSKKEFRKMILKCFLYSSFVEYIAGLVTFNLMLEYILCIVVSFLTVFIAYSKDNKAISNIGESILGFIGVILIILTLHKGISNYKEYSSLDTFIKMIIPVFFFISSIPYIYCFIVYAKYEELFCIIGILREKQESTPNRKRDALLWCRLDIDKISVFRKLFPINPSFTKQEFEKVVRKRITIEQLQDQWFPDY